MEKIALFIVDATGQERFAVQSNLTWESSSTIKVPIMFYTLHTMQERNALLDDTLERLPHHNTIGSGILNWTDRTSFTFRELISTTLRYSDCLATNMLLDYIGGQERLNEWLKDQGFSTQLLMPYLYFEDDAKETKMPQVGTTTARDLLHIYQALEQTKWQHDIRKLLRYTMSHVHESWFMTSLTADITACHHKTGSMIDSGTDGETVYNTVGDFVYNNKKYYFCLLSHDWLDRTIDKPEEQMRQRIAQYFETALLRL